MSEAPQPELPELIALAISAVGAEPPDTDQDARTQWIARLVDMTNTMAVLTHQHGPLAPTVGTIQHCTTYRGVVVGLVEQPRRQRSIIEVYTRSDGKWTIERNLLTPHKDSTEGRLIIDRAEALKGHEVVVFKDYEKFTDPRDSKDKQTKVCRYLHDLGPTDPTRQKEIQAQLAGADQDPETSTPVPVDTSAADTTQTKNETSGKTRRPEQVTMRDAAIRVWRSIDKTWPKQYREQHYQPIIQDIKVDNDGYVTNIEDLVARARATPAPA